MSNAMPLIVGVGVATFVGTVVFVRSKTSKMTDDWFVRETELLRKKNCQVEALRKAEREKHLKK